jgi:PAS domain S-box-containing protein
MSDVAPRPLNRVLLRLLLLRLFLPLVALSLVMVGLGGYWGAQRLSRQQLQLSRSVSSRVDDYLDHAGRSLGTLVLAAEEPETLPDVMAATWGAHGSFDAFYRLDDQGVVALLVPFNPRYLGMDMSNRSYFRRALEEGGLVISRPFTSLRSGEPTVNMAYVLEVGGMIVGELNLGALQRSVIAEHAEAGGSRVFIADRTGTLLAHPDFDLVAQQVNVSDMRIVRHGVGREVSRLYVYEGRLVLGTAAPVPVTGWVVVAETPFTSLFWPLLWMAVGVLTVSLMLWMGLVWGVRRQLRRQVVEPLARLSQGAAALTVGDFDQGAALAEIPTTYVEIGQLAMDFRRMSQALQARQVALRESEERLRTVVQRMPVMMDAFDAENRLIVWNRECERVTGYRAEELLGRADVLELLYPDPAYRERMMAELARRGNDFRNWEWRVRAKDGSVRTVAWSNISHQVAIPGWDAWAIGVDVTDRVQAQEALLRLQHLLQNITDSMPSALITVDLAGRVLTWNPAATDLLKVEADDAVDASLWTTCPQLARYRELFETVVREGQVAHRHREEVFADRDVLYCDIAIFPLVADDVSGAVVRIDDVTRRVQMEETMLQSAKLASLGGLAAGVAHEINNPLGAILQSVQMVSMALDVNRAKTQERLTRRGIPPEALNAYLVARGVPEYLSGIRQVGMRAAKIVSDLLSFSRKRAFEVQLHDINALLERTLGLAATDYDLKKQYDFRDVDIVWDLAPDLPPVPCDEQQMLQVLLNLVRNAAQAMAEKRAEVGAAYQPRLVLRTRQRPGEVEVMVEDNGPGVSEAVRARVFEPFFTTKEVGEGTGLGLWLCWSIVVERHQGRIWVEPAPDGGARFVVALPVA